MPPKNKTIYALPAYETTLSLHFTGLSAEDYANDYNFETTQSLPLSDFAPI